jgi:hypothetical protein
MSSDFNRFVKRAITRGCRRGLVVVDRAEQHQGWTPDVARTAHATFEGDRVTIENVRNFRYQSEKEYDQR